VVSEVLTDSAAYLEQDRLRGTFPSLDALQNINETGAKRFPKQSGRVPCPYPPQPSRVASLLSKADDSPDVGWLKGALTDKEGACRGSLADLVGQVEPWCQAHRTSADNIIPEHVEDIRQRSREGLPLVG
jgi:hypothetical protein